jgi:hypothetical protein
MGLRDLGALCVCVCVCVCPSSPVQAHSRVATWPPPHLTGQEMCTFKAGARQARVLQEAYEALPRPHLTPRESFERLMAGRSGQGRLAVAPAHTHANPHTRLLYA